MGWIYENKRILSITGLVFLLIIVLTFFNMYHASHLGDLYPQFLFFIYSSAILSFIIGILATYLFESKLKESQINKAIQFLPKNERKVCKILLERKEIEQNKLVSLSGLSNVKMSRIISSLEKRRVIEKRKHGYTNLISLRV